MRVSENLQTSRVIRGSVVRVRSQSPNFPVQGPLSGADRCQGFHNCRWLRRQWVLDILKLDPAASCGY